VELLVVIAIIAILSGITLSVFARAKAAGKNSVALSNASQIGKAMAIYVGDNDSALPFACSADDRFTMCSGETPILMPLLTNVLASYVHSKEVWQDPLDTGIPKVSGGTYSEPIECQLGGTSPTMYNKYGSSFVYRYDLGSEHVVEPYELISESSNKTISQAEIIVLHTAYGNWRGGPDVPSKRVIALYGDGHVKSVPLVNAHQQGAFRNLR